MTTTATGERDEVRAYLDALRTHLDDIPPDEREDILDDLEAHLAEVAAEAGEPLIQRLGPPDAYAADLRASAGYGPVAGTRRRRAAITEHRWVQVVRDAPETRPAWWVLRGLLVLTLTWLASGVPRQGGQMVLCLLLGIVTVPLSVALGRRAANGEYRTLSMVATAAALIAIPVGFVQIRDVAQTQYVYVDSGNGDGVLRAADGRPIFNIYPFAADGTPLEGVLLYDQDGMPVENLMPVGLTCCDADGNEYPQRQITDANGNPVGNSFPRSILIPDETGPRPDRRPAVRIPPMAPTTTAPPAATPTPAPTG